MFALTSEGPSLLWTEWRAGLSLPGGERIGSSWWPWRDADVLVVSWLAGWLSRGLTMKASCHLFVPLCNVAGSLNLALRSRVSYTLPASWTRPNAARRCYSPRWLARRQDCRRLALRVKLLCGRFPHTYVQSWTVTEIMAREVWNFDSCYTLVDYQIHIKTCRNMWFL
jgi:hypothetical protein